MSHKILHLPSEASENTTTATSFILYDPDIQLPTRVRESSRSNVFPGERFFFSRLISMRNTFHSWPTPNHPANKNSTNQPTSRMKKNHLSENKYTTPTLTAAERSCEDWPIRPVITVASFPTTRDLKRSVNNRPISLHVHRRGRAVIRLSCVILREEKKIIILMRSDSWDPRPQQPARSNPLPASNDIKRSFALAKQRSRPTPALTVYLNA